MSGLREAVAALDALAAGRMVDRAALLGGALALESLCRVMPELDLLDAAAGLETLARGGVLDLDAAGCARALALAGIVRRYAAA